MQTSDVLGRTPGMTATAASERRTRSLPLRRRLLLLTCALLGILGAVFSWMAYREVERALLLHGHEQMAVAAHDAQGHAKLYLPARSQAWQTAPPAAAAGRAGDASPSGTE